jgi:hypothetical protein
MEAFLTCDGVTIMGLAYTLASPEYRAAMSPIEFAALVARLFCNAFVAPLVFAQDRLAERENELLSRAFKLIERCQMKTPGKQPPSEADIIKELDANPCLESATDYVHGKNLLHISVQSGAHPLLIQLLINRGKVRLEQRDWFFRLPVEYCSGPSSAVLLPLFIHAGAARATEVCEVKKRKSREKAIGHAKY